MKANFLFVSLTLALANTAAAFPRAHPHSPCCNETIATNEYHAHIVSNYLRLWRGDLSILNETISPVMSFSADRFPASANCSTGKGSAYLHLTSSSDFGAFVAESRIGFAKYGFDPIYWLGQENKVAIRWSLAGVIGQNYTRLPT